MSQVLGAASRTNPLIRRDFQINVGPVTIAPGAIETLVVQPKMLFRVEKMIVYESVPGSTKITGIFVGAANQLPVTGGILSTVLSSNSFSNGVPWTPCQPGIPITINVENFSKTPCTWSGALFGKCVE